MLSKPLVSYQYHHNTIVLEQYPCYHSGLFWQDETACAPSNDVNQCGPDPTCTLCCETQWCNTDVLYTLFHGSTTQQSRLALFLIHSQTCIDLLSYFYIQTKFKVFYAHNKLELVAPPTKTKFQICLLLASNLCLKFPPPRTGLGHHEPAVHKINFTSRTLQVSINYQFLFYFYFLTQFLCQAICTQRTPKGPK